MAREICRSMESVSSSQPRQRYYAKTALVTGPPCSRETPFARFNSMRSTPSAGCARSALAITAAVVRITGSFDCRSPSQPVVEWIEFTFACYVSAGTPVLPGRRKNRVSKNCIIKPPATAATRRAGFHRAGNNRSRWAYQCGSGPARSATAPSRARDAQRQVLLRLQVRAQAHHVVGLGAVELQASARWCLP